MNLGNALIGYTGFVGSNLLESHWEFDKLYNSKNFQDMRGQKFNFVLCAGVSAVKWQANKNPEADLAQIEALIDVLNTIEAEQFILISTVDVYPDANNVDENTNLSGVTNHPYGTHRLYLENFIKNKFPNALTVRLPALFGPHLKKNILFDLLHDNMVENINPLSSFQWYDVRWLGSDIKTAWFYQLKLINLVPEPITTQEILNAIFPDRELLEKPNPVSYNVRTKWGKAFKQVDYIASREQVLESMLEWVDGELNA
jgi:nucleoside-diphosphate-sugar epimerase